ncbi:DUF4124 domain-containing protein [Pseudoalteromonas phenolica]|uniref:DUF4124 domain-containing protein n=1 Tax=Pseudoalteromonas phenolica TaxID=161398 RepID=UPI00110BEF86|nr:DUF4124 domain-containing protein [Pseudoalteromonas phenolica]TMO53725.1 hypothetical protein CWC21_18225 [Pseudoalteromonas phenolica]
MLKSLFTTLLILPFFVSAEKVTISYYKCVSDRGTIFSQHPCGNNGTVHTLTHSNPEAKIPPENHFKTLNNLEKQQIVRNLKREIRAKRQKSAILSRDRDRESREQQARLNRVMDDRKKQQTIQDVKKQLKSINKQYLKDIKDIDKQIVRLEKQLARYQ